MITACHADPLLARQVTIKDFSKFHDRLSAGAANGLNPLLYSGNRLKASQSNMILARWAASTRDLNCTAQVTGPLPKLITLHCVASHATSHSKW